MGEEQGLDALPSRCGDPSNVRTRKTRLKSKKAYMEASLGIMSKRVMGPMPESQNTRH